MTKLTIPAELLRDSGWRAALFILTSSTFRPGDPSVWKHVDLVERSLWFDRMLEGRAWSSTEELMLRAAWALFNSDTSVNLYTLANRLDDGQFKTIIEAMLVFRSRDYIPIGGLLHQYQHEARS